MVACHCKVPSLHSTTAVWVAECIAQECVRMHRPGVLDSIQIHVWIRTNIVLYFVFWPYKFQIPLLLLFTGTRLLLTYTRNYTVSYLVALKITLKVTLKVTDFKYTTSVPFQILQPRYLDLHNSRLATQVLNYYCLKRSSFV